MKPIKGFPGYFVTEAGEVFSCKRKGKIKLSQQKSTRGYLQVDLYRAEKGRPRRYTFYVHRLVLLAYKPERRPEQNECRHLDRDKTNNRVSNLEWGTTKENAEDNKCVPRIRKRTHHLRKEEVFAILSSPLGVKDLAQYYKIHPESIRRIRRGGSWSKYYKEFNNGNGSQQISY